MTDYQTGALNGEQIGLHPTSTPATGVHRSAARNTRAPGIWLSLATSALGVVAVSVSYGLGRSDVSGAQFLLWLGQLIIFAPLVAFVLMSPYLRRAEIFLLAAYVGLESAIIKIDYSPLVLGYPDELQHVRGTIDAVESGRVGGFNPSLPISAKYPGLEALGAAFIRVTGLSADTAGLVIGAVLHIAFLIGLGLFFLMLRISPRYVALGLLIYSMNGSFSFINSMFIYENLGLVFLIGALCSALALRQKGRYPGVTGFSAYSLIVLTVISHHVTAVILALVLLIVALVDCVRRDSQNLRLSVPLSLASLVSVAFWFSVVAKSTLSYIRPFTSGIAKSTSNAVIVPSSSQELHDLKRPTVDTLAADATLIVFSVLVLASIWYFRRTQKRSWNIALTVLSLGLLTGNATALTTARGDEFAGRLSSYSYVGVAFVVAGFLLKLVSSRRGAARAVVAVVLVLAFGGAIANAWPPWWERVPGQAHARGFESGQDEPVTAAAGWARRSLVPDSKFAADWNGGVALQGRGQQIVVAQSYTLFFTFSPEQALAAARAAKIKYIWVDSRLPTEVSPTGSFFPVGSSVTTLYRPTAANLANIGKIVGVSKIYDNGVISIYEMSRSS